MARSFYVNQESLVQVKAGAHVLSPSMSGSAVVVLGVAETGIVVTPSYEYTEILTDLMGKKPCEIMGEMYDVKVRMELIHFDKTILEVCETEGSVGYQQGTTAKTIAGGLIGNNLSLYASGNFFMGMAIKSPVKTWRFPAAWLDQTPEEFPLGTSRSKVILNWRSIAYVTIGGGGVETVQCLPWDYSALT